MIFGIIVFSVRKTLFVKNFLLSCLFGEHTLTKFGLYRSLKKCLFKIMEIDNGEYSLTLQSFFSAISKSSRKFEKMEKIIYTISFARFRRDG